MADTPWFETGGTVPLPTRTRYKDLTKEQRSEHARERNKIRCPRCPNFWTGLRACHCSACHLTFSGITAFDMHRDGNHQRSTRHCLDPATMRAEDGTALLVLVEKNGWAAWSQPGTYDGPYESDGEQ